MVALTMGLCPCISFGEAAATPPATSDQAGGVQPTVTVAMGDVGGHYFGHTPDPSKTRHYYIAAEPVLWNFAPDGQDPVCGKTLPAALLLNRVGWKIRYVQYADAAFSARILPDPRLGILGPVIRGTTGEYVSVTFLNRGWLPLSIHPHGVRYDKDSEGSYYKPAPGLGAAIAPGAKYTYVWKLDESAGPRPDEPSSKAWLYHSHVTGDAEANLGLVGFIVVTDPARARPDGTPKDVDREMGLLFKIFNEENTSDDPGEEPDEKPLSAAPTGPLNRTWAEAQQVAEEGQRNTINGLTFGNLPGLDMNEGERVRWYVFGLGSESDFHTAHWHGMNVIEDGRRRTDVVELLPGSMKVADMVADNPGQWLLHCHVAEHMDQGMFARMKVYPMGQNAVSREPEAAFFGMPQSVRTLRVQTAEISIKKAVPLEGEIYIDAQVTIPDPFAVSKQPITFHLGNASLTLHPDASGISASPEGVLLIKNLSPYGNGNVVGGKLNFEITLKGGRWMAELKRLQLIQGSALSAAPLPISLEVGNAHHETTCVLKKSPES